MAVAIQWGFSPEGSADELDSRFIAAAKTDLRVMAYGVSSKSFVDRLIAAKARGVDVSVVCDYRENVMATGWSGVPGIGVPYLKRLVAAGISVRTCDVYPVHHDKVMVADGRHVRTGSCNFTTSAERANSENVVVLWRHAPLAQAMLGHFQSRWNAGKDFVPPVPSALARLVAHFRGQS